nr:transposase domain-containing protein [Bacteroidota bacterium]
MGTCKINNINPYQWLEQTLPLINDTKPSQLNDLVAKYNFLTSGSGLVGGLR